MIFTKVQTSLWDRKNVCSVLKLLLVWESKVLVIGSQSVLREFRAILNQFARESVGTLL